jgi:hypothetical protein
MVGGPAAGYKESMVKIGSPRVSYFPAIVSPAMTPCPLPLAGAVLAMAAACGGCGSTAATVSGASSGTSSAATAGSSGAGGGQAADNAGGSGSSGGTASGSSSGASTGSSSGASTGSSSGASTGSSSGSASAGAGTGTAGASAGSSSGPASGGTGGDAASGNSGGTDGGSGALADSGGTGSDLGGTSYPYVFSVFDDAAPISDLRIYTSDDALNFTLLSDTGYTGPTGFLRDPSIMKANGKFYVAFTTPPTLGCCGPETSFGIGSSTDLKKWTTIATVDCGVPGTNNTWAPEWFKDLDGSVYAIVNVDGKTYSYKAMDATMTTFGAPTWIGIGPGYIDTFIVTIGATYHAFTKSNATYIEHATATSLQGPWTFIGKNDWAGWGTHKEAPALILLPTGTWRFYTDAGSTGHEMYSDSADVFQTWTAPKTLPTVGNDISHGTVIKGN